MSDELPKDWDSRPPPGKLECDEASVIAASASK